MLSPLAWPTRRLPCCRVDRRLAHGLAARRGVESWRRRWFLHQGGLDMARSGTSHHRKVERRAAVEGQVDRRRGKRRGRVEAWRGGSTTERGWRGRVSSRNSEDQPLELRLFLVVDVLHCTRIAKRQLEPSFRFAEFGVPRVCPPPTWRVSRVGADRHRNA